MGGRKDLITAGLTLGALADAEAKAKGKMSAIIATESGSAVSFTAADAAPVADLTAAIVPVQVLHGYDAPWAPGAGKNLLDPNEAETLKYVRSDGSVMTTSGWSASGYIRVTAGSTYVLNIRNSGVTAYHAFYDANKEFVSSVISTTSPITIPSDASYIRLSMKTVEPGTAQFELGSSATSFAPYSNICPISGWTECKVYRSGADTSDPTIYTVTFGSAGTVYGGTLDVTTGTLTVTKANIASYNGETLPGAWISDRDVYAVGTTPTIGAQVVYDLAEPIVYNLTPVEIRTLVGQNTIWADTGDVTVKYSADTKAFIDNYIAARRNG